MSALVGIFIKNTGKFREPIWFGMIMMTLGFGLFIDLPSTKVWSKIFIYQIVAGLGVVSISESFACCIFVLTFGRVHSSKVL